MISNTQKQRGVGDKSTSPSPNLRKALEDFEKSPAGAEVRLAIEAMKATASSKARPDILLNRRHGWAVIFD